MLFLLKKLSFDWSTMDRTMYGKVLPGTYYPFRCAMRENGISPGCEYYLNLTDTCVFFVYFDCVVRFIFPIYYYKVRRMECLFTSLNRLCEVLSVSFIILSMNASLFIFSYLCYVMMSQYVLFFYGFTVVLFSL